MASKLPQLAERIIRFFCRESLQEEILGNLEEYCHLHANSRLRIWIEVLKYLRPTFFKPFHPFNHRFHMFNFNPKLAFRNLQKQGTNAVINIFGFTVGLTCVFFLYFYVSEELQYDRFHRDYESIYRVLRLSSNNGNAYKIGVTSGPYARALENDFGEDRVKTMRALPSEDLVEYQDHRFYEKEILLVDPDFFTFFSFPLKSGDPKTVLKNPNSVVLTETMAKKYFNNEDPLGKLIEVSGHSFEVTGIVGELPDKSHLEFEFLLSMELVDDEEWMNNWWNNGLITYAKIEDPQDAAYILDHSQEFMDKYFGEDFKRTGGKMGLTLEPLADVYFNNDTRYDEAKHGDIKNILILSLVAAAILFIACFNYMNMTIALAFRRSKEVGIRKIMGGSKVRLILQFIGESLMLILFSVVLAGGLSQVLLPFLNSTFGLEVQYQWSDPNVWLFFMAIIALVALVSGLYPALLLSSFKPLRIIKGKLFDQQKNIYLRKGLVITQFVISIFLVAVTFLVAIQMHFVNSKNLGFTKEEIVVLDLNNQESREKIDVLKKKLEHYPDILETTAISGEPGGFHDASTMEILGMDKKIRFRTLFADYQYLKTFDVNLLQGRDFDKSYGEDMNGAVILNQKALHELGMTAEEVLGKTIRVPIWDDYERKVIGIVEDYHFQSLKQPIEPLGIMLGGRPRKLAIKLQTNTIHEGTDHITSVWNELIDGYPCMYKFLDNSLHNLYQTEQKQHAVFTSFSVISLILASLGIFGLVSYSAQRRKKEIGIRKVLGASTRQILSLFSKEFLILIGISFILSIPLAWVFINRWLEDFSYRINPENYWYVYLISGGIALVIALVTISFRSVRVAASNPVDSIRYE